ncbi:hypothetical protein [Neobacillus niacini]|uniref:hypothetical protein n=1 Tax=Neobacillus niacini TaxID=86668 RepID=UPI001C8D38C7|nr:hypothetical protein [Neobacillus niacini]MBY0144317.1 hypothetical protein [Neobacillus niacini]
MLSISVQMEMTVSQLDWLSRPFIKKEYPDYEVKFKMRIPESNFYTEPISYDPAPVGSYRFTTPEEEYRLIQFEKSGIEGQIEGQEFRKFLLELKKKIEKEIGEIGIDKNHFFIEVTFEAKELPDFRVY